MERPERCFDYQELDEGLSWLINWWVKGEKGAVVYTEMHVPQVNLHRILTMNFHRRRKEGEGCLFLDGEPCEVRTDLFRHDVDKLYHKSEEVLYGVLEQLYKEKL